jgi:hypothetical protein
MSRIPGSEPEGDEVIQVLFIGALIPDLKSWLAQRNARLVLIPMEDDDLPTYVIHPNSLDR